MKKILIFAFLLLASTVIFAQKDTNLIKILSKPIANCELIAFNSQAMISKLSLEKIDSIKQILDIWESKCSANEPITRLKILMCIQKNQLSDNLVEQYIAKSYNNFRSRLADANFENGENNYENYKFYYHYVPLNGDFDAFTKRFASKLLQNQEKGTIEHLFCLLFSEQTEDFEKTIYSKKFNNSKIQKAIKKNGYTVWTRPSSFSLHVGVWQPIEKSNNVFITSPQIGFKMGLPLGPKSRIDIGTMFRFHNSKPFEMKIEEETKMVKSKTSLSGGFWLTKNFTLKENLYLDGTAGICIGAINTDWKMTKKTNEQSSNYGVSTIDNSLGITLRKSNEKQKNKCFGFNISYHFTPYYLDERLITPIGSHYMTAGFIWCY